MKSMQKTNSTNALPQFSELKKKHAGTLHSQQTDLTTNSNTLGDGKSRIKKLTNKVKMVTKFGIADTLNPSLRKFNTKASQKDVLSPKDSMPKNLRDRLDKIEEDKAALANMKIADI
jgi:hypothetical protein